MGWRIEVLIVFIKYRSKDIGGAERKLLDPYLGKWVYGTHIDASTEVAAYYRLTDIIPFDNSIYTYIYIYRERYI